MDSIEIRVDEIFTQYVEPDSPGGAVAVLSNGTVVLSKGYGLAQLEHDIPITPATVFRVASMSKQFTAAAITMLELQGELSVDDDLHDYLPEFPDYGEPITLRHLLHHMSGLRDDLTLWVLAGNRIEDVITQNDLLSLVRRQKQLNFPPASRYGYSDTNYDLLAEIVSSVTGESFARWTEANLLLPVGMTSSRFVDDYALPVRNRAFGYERNEVGASSRVPLNMGWVGSSGLHSTVLDLARWLQAFESRQVLGDDVVEAMLTRGVLASGDTITYARGLNVDTYAGRRVIKHSGTNGGFSCHMSYFPDDRLGVVVLFNYPASAWDVADAVADIFLRRPMVESAEGAQQAETTAARSGAGAGALTADRLAAYTGTYWYEQSYSWLLRDVVAEDGRLYYVRSADNRSELIPRSEHDFLVAGSNGVVVRFSGEANGRFASLRYNAEDPAPSAAVRVDRFEPTASELAEYEGLYYSVELDALHRLVVREGELFNSKFRMDAHSSWTPVVRDRFVFLDRVGHVTFRRDELGRIAGYVLDLPRAQHIAFTRLN
jgi:CubicO group peptidase (beta-lactamase class C family)